MTKDECIQKILDGTFCNPYTLKEECPQCYFHMHYQFKKNDDEYTECYLIRLCNTPQVKENIQNYNGENYIFNHIFKMYKLKKIKRILK